jgi:hypothetical protein
MSNLQSIHTLPLVKTLFSNNKHLLNALEKLHSDRTGLTRWQRIKGVLDASETVFNDETANVFLNKVKTEPQYASQFSKEEIDAVKELHQNWNTPDVQRLTSKSDFELTGSIDEWSLSDIVTQGKFELPEAPFKSWLQTGDPFADHKYKMIGID